MCLVSVWFFGFCGFFLVLDGVVCVCVFRLCFLFVALRTMPPAAAGALAPPPGAGPAARLPAGVALPAGAPGLLPAAADPHTAVAAAAAAALPAATGDFIFSWCSLLPFFFLTVVHVKTIYRYCVLMFAKALGLARFVLVQR